MKAINRRWISWLAVTVGLFIAGITTGATAQWVNLPYAGPFHLQVDRSSVRRISDREFRASWRSGRDLEQRFSEFVGIIDCFDIRVTLEQEMRIDKTGWPDPKFHTWKYNYLERTSEHGGRSSEMGEQEESRAVKYPSTLNSEFQVIRYLCESEPVLKENHEVGGATLQARYKCDRADNAGTAICKPDQETRELLGLLTTRTVQIEEACRVDSVELDNLLAHWLSKSMKCRTRGGEPCGLSSLHWATHGLGEDLARVQLGQSCTYLPDALQSMKKEERDEVALDIFRTCVTKNISALDDRISPANIVAEGVIASCRSHLTASLVSGPEFISGILPTITAGVLRARQEPRPTAARKPKTSQRDGGGAASKKK